MTNAVGAAALAAQKARLIAQGDSYRAGLAHARVQMAQSLRPDALLHGVLDHALGFATARLEHLLAPTGLRVQTVMPYLIAALSFLARKKLIKPAIGIGAAAAGALWLMRRKGR